MSGTSADAVDAVLVELSGCGSGTTWKLLQHSQQALPDSLRDAVLAMARGQPPPAPLGGRSPAAQVALLDQWMGELFAAAAMRCLSEAGLGPGAADLAACHGQTICHLPDAVDAGGFQLRTTLQIGSAPLIAARLGLPVISDFRRADMALGGQGAPLAPYADWVLFAKPGSARAIQNLGGIGNVTYLAGPPEEMIAFDTGPANMVLDAAVRTLTEGRLRFDEDGRMASRGRISPALLKRLLDHPFLSKKPPKSTGHEDFGEEYWREVRGWAAAEHVGSDDLVATLTAIPAEAAARAYRDYLPRFPDEVILGGGGSLNPVMVDHFRRLCHPAVIRRHEEFGIAAQAKEGLIFAILANETMHGNPSNVPHATGASGGAVLGCLHLPPLGAHRPEASEDSTYVVRETPVAARSG